MDMPDKVYVHIDRIGNYYCQSQVAVVGDQPYTRTDLAQSLADALEGILDSDMAAREEDEGRVSKTLEKARAALTEYKGE